MSVILETTIGDIIIDLFTSERPRACLNFLKLCKIKYYNYCLFHSIQQNFLAQTGDPTGRGNGGESVFRSLYGDQAKFFEAETKPRLKHKSRGTVSMANNGDNLHGSQFFITLGDDLDYLDGVHTVFAEVVEGFEVLDKLNEAICDDEHRPYQDIRINHTVIIDDPYDDPAGLVVPDRSPEPTKEQLDSGRIGADEEIDDTKGKTMEEIDEMIEERELKAGTQILEMVGDLPDADMAPPENVLFVCKLNPVTQDQDLEIIFSRFGPIKSCEVIRDQKTGESLQYAFIEFENVEDCERAYFKMDNVLIDDRRIHVDFSQSVAKVQMQKQGAKPVFPDKSEKDKPKFAIKGQKQSSNYDLVFDDDHSDRKSGSKQKGQKERSNKDKDFSKSTIEKERKPRHSDNDNEDNKRERKHGGKERDRRPERKESYSSDDSPRDRRKRDKQERRRSPSSSDDNMERIKKKKKHGDEFSRSHKHSEEKHAAQLEEKSRDHKNRRDRDHSPRHKDRNSKHYQEKHKHSEGHKSRHSSHEYKHHSSHRY